MLSFFIFFAEFCSACTVYPFMPSGLFYHNYLDQSISNSRVSGLFLLLSPRFLEASGILLSPPSVCPSVRPCVRYVISSQTAGQNPTKFGEWLAYTSGACKSMFIFGPASRDPGEGSKGQILTISKSILKIFMRKCAHILSSDRCKTY